MLDWLIIGGGPHGVHMACRLLDRGVRHQGLAILDPHSEPLAHWSHCTKNTGMLHLRSPSVHSLDVDPLALGRHAETEAFLEAKQSAASDEADFIPPYCRPSLRLFMHHVQSLIESNDLMRRWRSARAISIEDSDGCYCVQTEARDSIEARNVVLALGAGDQPNWPDWAADFRDGKERGDLFHIFDHSFERERIAKDDDVAIVGAGISAAQLALALLQTNPHRRITLVSRHFLKREDFDSDPGWLGPLLLKGYQKESCYTRRRAIIQNARHRGTMAAEVSDRLQKAILKEQSIALEMGDIESLRRGARGDQLELLLRSVELDEGAYEETGELVLQFCEQTKTLQANTIVLATGFEPERPGGRLIDETIEALQLPTAEDGFPIVDRYLRWRAGLFVTGPLAELEIGPASRNLSGARMAAERVIRSPEADQSAGPVSLEEALRMETLEETNLDPRGLASATG